MESVDEKIRRVVASRKGEEEGRDQRYLETSRQRLLKIVKKKATTSFIGAIARFEQFMGALWGHGKPPEECTADELAWREVWEECRNEILNNANNQQRAVENEFAQYTIRWNRYVTSLPVGGPPPAVVLEQDNPNRNPEEEQCPRK